MFLVELEKGKPPEKVGRKVTDLSLLVGEGGRTAGQLQKIRPAILPIQNKKFKRAFN
jgi:hypothetical protein